MSSRRIAGACAFTLAAILASPAIAHADTSSATTLYVNNEVGSICSDSGTGTADQPYCTIQAAVDAVNPGQTVYIVGGNYVGPIDITRSGTAGAPITITAATPSVQDAYATTVEGTSTTTPAIAITNAQYINISNIWVLDSVGDMVQVSDSSNITMDRMQTGGGAPTGSTRLATSAGFHVTGGSNNVTVQRSESSGTGLGIEIDGGSTNTMVSTNSVRSSNGSNSIEIDDAPHTTITSNTTHTVCAQSLLVDNGSDAAVIENNVLLDSCRNTGSSTMTLDAAAASSAVADYNALSGGSRYNWAGSTYATAAAFATAVGQGAHDIDTGFLGGIATIDSANSDAPGELSTDVHGQARVDDPVVANTGVGAYSYYDRGASETQEPLSVTLNASATHASIGSTVTFTATPVDTWASSFSYTFDFGDGTKITDATGVETHPYTATGTYWPFVTVTSLTGASTITGVSGAPIDVRAPLVPVLAGGYLSDLTLWVDWVEHTTDGWSPTSATIDFGDCSARFTTSAPALYDAIHTYAAPGIYTVTLTVQDTVGNTATTSKTYTTPGYTGISTWCGPRRILEVPDSTTGTNAGTTLAAQSAPLFNPGFHGIGSPLTADTVAPAPATSGANHPAGTARTPAAATAGDTTPSLQDDSGEIAHLAQLIVSALAHFARW